MRRFFRYYDKEVPYSVEVVVERFRKMRRKYTSTQLFMWSATAKKGIIIGHKGVAIKKVMTEARKTLEKFFQKMHLP